MRRLILPFLFGLSGMAVLLALGFWQLERLEWKEALLADMAARLDGPAQPLPAAPVPEADNYRPIALTGRLTGQEAFVLTSRPLSGPGFRVIAVFETEAGRRVLLDRGFVPAEDRAAARPAKALTTRAHLFWAPPNPSAPPPDAARGEYFSREAASLAAGLGTEPLLLVAAEETGDGVTPWPLDTSAVPNDHLNYARTWFSLALVWAAMTGYWLFRLSRKGGRA